MILGIDPEDRDCRDVVLRSNTLGELKSSECFQQREERSAEEPSLLARHDGHRGGIAKDGCGCLGNGRRTAALLLRLKHLDDGVALPAVTGCACDGVAPRGGIARIAGKEVRQARVVERVVRRQPSDPREPTNIDGNATARGCVPLSGGGGLGGQTCVGLHLSVLLQSVARSVKKTGCECYDRLIP